MPVLEHGRRVAGQGSRKGRPRKNGGAPATANRHVIEEPAPTRAPVGSRWGR